MKPLFWNVLLEIKPPETKSAGGIIFSEDVQEREAMLTMVGKVVELGPMAFKTKTSGGHDYRVHHPDYTVEGFEGAPQVGVGSYVLISRKFGIPIRMKDGATYQLCNDYEIIAVITEEEAAKIRGYV